MKQKLARWYWCGVFGELYGGGNEARFALDVQQLPQWIDGGDEPRTVADANFVPGRLLTMQSRLSAAYKGVMALLMDRGSLDLITGDPIHIVTEMNEDVDIHHLFPVAHCNARGYDRRRWNSVVNKSPLTARSNRRIGGSAPSIYLAKIDNELAAERVDEILRTHAVDPAVIRADAFDDFIRHRAATLLDLISKAMGKSVAGRESEDTLRAFGGAL